MDRSADAKAATNSSIVRHLVATRMTFRSTVEYSIDLTGSDRALVHWLRLTRGPIDARDRPLVGRPARHPGITRARRELRNFGVATALDFVWSDDGSGVLEEEPRTIHVHLRMRAADRAPAKVRALSQRTAALDMADVIRHEIGHALVFLDPRITRTAGFRGLFGDVARAYRVTTAADEIERRLVRHRGLANPRYRRVVSLYAATHPHEAFAEAVRLAMALGGASPRIDAWVAAHDLDPVVGAQIRFAADWLRAYRRG